MQVHLGMSSSILDRLLGFWYPSILRYFLFLLLSLVSEVATNSVVLKYSISVSGHTSKTKENTG